MDNGNWLVGVKGQPLGQIQNQYLSVLHKSGMVSLGYVIIVRELARPHSSCAHAMIPNKSC